MTQETLKSTDGLALYVQQIAERRRDGHTGDGGVEADKTLETGNVYKAHVYSHNITYIYIYIYIYIYVYTYTLLLANIFDRFAGIKYIFVALVLCCVFCLNAKQLIL